METTNMKKVPIWLTCMNEELIEPVPCQGSHNTFMENVLLQTIKELCNEYKDIDTGYFSYNVQEIDTYIAFDCQQFKTIWEATSIIEEHIKQNDSEPDKGKEAHRESKPVGGDHYESMIQPIDYILANNMDFVEGNIIKYVTRYKKKNGLEDLEKARWYLDRLIERKGGTK
jgi:hypothetical protein